MTQQVPDQALFHIAQRETTLHELAHRLYPGPSVAPREHFKQLNSHIEDGEVSPGEMVVLTPDDESCVAWESQLVERAEAHNEVIAKRERKDRETLAENYGLIYDVSSKGSMTAGWINNYFKTRVNEVKSTLGELEQLHRDTYRKHGKLRGHQTFYDKRAKLFRRMDRALGRIPRRQIFGRAANLTGIKSQMGLSTKSVVHQFKAHGGADAPLPQFQTNQARVMKAARTFRTIGYVGIALDIGASAARIAEVCQHNPDSEKCERTAFKQTGRAAGSVLGGMGGGLVASYGACTLVLGLTTGPGAIACGIVAGGAGGIVGSQVGGSRLKSMGGLVYQRIVKPSK